jgi:hypothetical protein
MKDSKELTGLIEMWGYFMGREYAHRRYGSNAHSLCASPNFANSWYAVGVNRNIYKKSAAM